MGCKSYPDLPARGETAAAERKSLPGLTLEQHGGEAPACTERCSTRVEQRPEPLCSKTSSELLSLLQDGHPRLVGSAGGARRGDEHRKGGFTRGRRGATASSFQRSNLSHGFLAPSGVCPLSATSSFTLNLFPSPSRRGCVSQLRVGTPGQGRRLPEQWPQRALAPGGPPGPARPRLQQGEQGLCTAQQQRPPTAGLARILETHVECRERKKAAEFPRNYC